MKHSFITNKKIDKEHTDITYPQLEFKDEKIAAKINKQISEIVLQFIKAESLYLKNTDFLYGNYKITLNRSDLLSLTIEFCSCKEESNISFTTLKSLTIDTSTASMYNFKDLFDERSDYDTIINKIVLEDIRDNNVPIIEEFGNMNKYRNFYLLDDSLMIYYNLNRNSRYASYYYFPHFRIPYYKIKEIMSPNGPLTKLKK